MVRHYSHCVRAVPQMLLHVLYLDSLIIADSVAFDHTKMRIQKPCASADRRLRELDAVALEAITQARSTPVYHDAIWQDIRHEPALL